MGEPAGRKPTAASWVAALGALSPFPCAAPRPAPPAAAQKPPQVVAPATPAATEAVPGLDPREERRLAKELGQRIEEYYRLLKEKNVEEAVAYVEPQFQKAYLDDLWSFAATYSIEGVQAHGYEFFPQPDGTLAKVKVARTLFEKGSVVPMKSEVWMTWMQRGGRWLIRPQEQK